MIGRAPTEHGYYIYKINKLRCLYNFITFPLAKTYLVPVTHSAAAAEVVPLASSSPPLALVVGFPLALAPVSVAPSMDRHIDSQPSISVGR